LKKGVSRDIRVEAILSLETAGVFIISYHASDVFNLLSFDKASTRHFKWFEKILLGDTILGLLSVAREEEVSDSCTFYYLAKSA
jgi:hypothetical protein